MEYPYKEDWWETKDHKKIKISDMETSHIENTIKCLQRHSDFYDEYFGDNWFGYDYEDNSELVDKKIEKLQYKKAKWLRNLAPAVIFIEKEEYVPSFFFGDIKLKVYFY